MTGDAEPLPTPARTFKPRNRTKPDVYLLPSDPSVLVKDYRRRNLLVRLFGRFSLHNEERALSRLAGVQGIPAFHGRTSPYVLAMEFVDGRPLSELRESGGVPPDFADRLEKVFAAMESRGVYHGDPHFRNILCGPDGQPYLIDFSWSYVRGTLPLIDGWIVRNLEVVRKRRIQKLRRVFYGDRDAPDVRPGWFYRLMLSLKRTLRRLKKWRKG